MASGEEPATYRAARLGTVGLVIDLCCGIGGDLVALAKRNYVCGIDSNPTRLAMARMNAAALGGWIRPRSLWQTWRLGRMRCL